MIRSVPQWDRDIFYALNGTRGSFLDVIMPIFSYTWLLWALGIAAFTLWGVVVYRRTGSWRSLRPVFFGVVLILSTAGVNDLITNAVKDHVGRLRPLQALEHTYYKRGGVWQKRPTGYEANRQKSDSFFSGHASHSMAVAVTAATLCPPLSPVIFAMPVLVGYSRVYLGKHYPSDVACGWLAGAAVALIARRLTRRIRENLGLPVRKRLPEEGTVARVGVCCAKKVAGSE